MFLLYSPLGDHVTQDWGWLASIQHETLGTWTVFILSVCQLHIGHTVGGE